MEKAGNFNYGEVPEGVPLRTHEDATALRGKGFNLDSEVLIKKAFETNSNQGIELLFRYYYRSLCSHAVRYVSSKEIAEDIVSDVFFKFHSEQTFLDVKTSFRAYLFTSVRHRAFDYVRVELKRSTSMQFAEFIPIQPDQQPDHITQYEDLYNDVENAVNSLPLKRRRIFVMHRFEGKKYQEIAAELNLSLRTVEAQMFQALHQVRSIIRDKWFVLLLAFME
ncbi:RNA polymerase sigma-70 factor [Dyadobacter bucti]|jgi:RNA polymerase sigma-70 factor (family 1)|uniref:RNA polymerase sigma-70 factor n=1 Tax=Dyadobacter bucti TaxID=2572203 RepID=UPI001108FDCE|nr:RNA polymerase sigma-70 factor [Dyadobacter bucti]